MINAFAVHKIKETILAANGGGINDKTINYDIIVKPQGSKILFLKKANR